VAKQFVHVYRSTDQTGIVTATYTKIKHQTVVFDNSSVYDNVTNFRMTPTIAGKYLIIASAAFNNLSDQIETRSAIYVNGSVVQEVRVQQSGTQIAVACSSAIRDINGTTDYIEHFIRHDAGSNQTLNSGQPRTFFMAMRIST